MFQQKWRPPKNKRSNFNPGHEYVEKSVRNFLTKGGKITQLEPSTVSLEFDKILVDQFLMGEV